MMTNQSNYSPYEAVLQLINEHGFDQIRGALEILLNEAMKHERSQALGAQEYVRTEERTGYSNGFKGKKLKTRVGELNLKVPQTRGTAFYPSALEKRVRSERALLISLAEMYVRGISTRRVSGLLEKMCGTEISSSTVSRISAQMDEELGEWRQKPLGRTPYLFLDAKYENVRHGGCNVRCAVLIGIGVRDDGRRSVLGVSVSMGEHEVHWREFLQGLEERGMHGVELITSDDHKGLKAARQACFPTVPWNRCQFHLQQNASSYVPRMDMKTQVADDIRAIFDSPDKQEADRMLRRAVEKYESKAPRLSRWMEENLPEGLTVFQFEARLRKRLRTSNVVERLNEEISRRTKVAGMFPNEASALRLITAVVMEKSEEWKTGRIYLRPISFMRTECNLQKRCCVILKRK
jgi:putative transposase